MDSLKPLSIAGIIKETIKIFFKNGKLMPSITFFSLLIYSILYISDTLMTDLFAKLPILLHESIFFLITKTFTLFVFISTISASSIVYSKKDLPHKKFFSRVLRSWKKPLFTLFYTYLLYLGYMCLLFSVMFALAVIPKSNNSLLVLFLLCTMIMVPALTLFYIYLDVILTLSLVVSVLDENCYRFEAFAKTKKLIKGRKLQGFRLALLFTLTSIGVMRGVGLLNPAKQSRAVQTIIGLLVTNSNNLVEIFGLVAFTLFYYDCKKIHGEEVVEEEGYTKLPNTSYATSEDVA